LSTATEPLSAPRFYDLGLSVRHCCCRFQLRSNPDSRGLPSTVRTRSSWPAKATAPFNLHPTRHKLRRGNRRHRVIAADFTATDSLDLLTNNLPASILRQLFSGWERRFASPLEEDLGAIEVADFNGDHRADMTPASAQPVSRSPCQRRLSAGPTRFLPYSFN